MPSPTTFAAWLKQRRRDSDLTQEALAELVGVSDVTIAKIESGARRPSKQVAALLAQALKLPSDSHEAFIAFARGGQSMSAASLPQSTSAVQPPAPLPASTTPLLGRSAELAQIAHVLHDPMCRLLTLTGPGGVGKTRLAVQAATECASVFVDGVAFVSLVGVAESAMLPSAIASALGLTLGDSADITTQLLAHLRSRQLLLVLDNLEHLLGDGQTAGLIEQILAHAAALKILATSRESLHLHGEWVFHVQGLPVLSEDAPTGAVQLFLQAARRANVSFAAEADSADLDHIAQICRQVEGVPLAIELAAAWCATLRPSEIAAHIAQDMGFLALPELPRPTRQGSLRAVFEQSWRLLSEAEQQGLAALSVFRGGFMSDAALAVADADLPMLARLQSRSLLRRVESAVGTLPRFEVHELVRQFAAEQLSPSELRSVRNRHELFYAFLMNGAEAQLRSVAQRPMLQRLRADVDNVRAMWDWAVAQRDIVALNQALRGVARLCAIQSWNEEAVARFGAAAALFSDASTIHQLTYQSWFMCSMGHVDGALALQQRIFARIDALGIEAPSLVIEPLLFHALTCYQARQYERAAEIMQRVVQLARHLRNPWFEGVARHALAFGEFMHKRELVHSFAEMSVAAELLRSEGDVFQAMYVWYDAARVAIAAERYAEAAHLLADCDGVAAQLDNPAIHATLAQLHAQLAAQLAAHMRTA